MKRRRVISSKAARVARLVPHLVGPSHGKLDSGVPLHRAIGVDEERGVIRGMALASVQEAKGKGYRLDRKSAELTVAHVNAAPGGLRSRLSHPTECAKVEGRHLGRVTNGWLDESGKLPIARGDLTFARSAYNSLGQNLAGYVMSLAKEDSFAGGSSIIWHGGGPEHELDAKGKPVLDAETGEEALPVLRHRSTLFVDVVDDPAANVGFFGEAGAARFQEGQLSAAADEFAAGLLSAGGIEGALAWARTFAAQQGFDLTMEVKPVRIFGKNKKAPVAKQADEGNLGARLGGLLDGVLEVRADDKRPRASILQEMASSAEMELEDVAAIVAGTAEPESKAQLDAFAEVLEIAPEKLHAAAEADGVEFADPEVVPPKDGEPMPPAAGAMSAVTARLDAMQLQLDAGKAEHAATKAALEAAQAALAKTQSGTAGEVLATVAEQKRVALEQAQLSGQLPGSLFAMAQAYAAAHTATELSAMIATLPKVTHEKPAGHSGDKPKDKIKVVDATDEERKIMELAGLTAQQLNAYEGVSGVRPDGSYQMSDGRVLTKAELGIVGNA